MPDPTLRQDLIDAYSVTLSDDDEKTLAKLKQTPVFKHLLQTGQPLDTAEQDKMLAVGMTPEQVNRFGRLLDVERRRQGGSKGLANELQTQLQAQGISTKSSVNKAGDTVITTHTED